MNLVEIAKGVSLNPEKVIAVKVEDIMHWKDSSAFNREWVKTGKTEVAIYVEQIDGEDSVTFSVRYVSDYTYQETKNRLQEVDYGICEPA